MRCATPLHHEAARAATEVGDQLPRQSFEVIRGNLEATLDFCRSIELDTDQSRFAEYRKRLDHLITVVRLRRYGVTVGRSVEEELRQEGLHYIITLTESTEFGDILPFLRTCDPNVIRPKLRNVLRGPLLPTDEDADSNQARNILFELNLAARLHRAGFEPVVGERPDVACEVDGKWLFFECKRPFSPGKISKLITKAARQLKSDLAARPGARGVIAMSLSKVMNAGDRLYTFDQEAEGRLGLADALTEAAWRFRNAEQQFVGSKIVGMIYHVITPALNRDLDMYYVVQQLEAHPLASDGSADYRAFHALGRALEDAQY